MDLRWVSFQNIVDFSFQIALLGALRYASVMYLSSRVCSTDPLLHSCLSGIKLCTWSSLLPLYSNFYEWILRKYDSGLKCSHLLDPEHLSVFIWCSLILESLNVFSSLLWLLSSKTNHDHYLNLEVEASHPPPYSVLTSFSTWWGWDHFLQVLSDTFLLCPYSSFVSSLLHSPLTLPAMWQTFCRQLFNEKVIASQSIFSHINGGTLRCPVSLAIFLLLASIFLMDCFYFLKDTVLWLCLLEKRKYKTKVLKVISISKSK